MGLSLCQHVLLKSGHEWCSLSTLPVTKHFLNLMPWQVLFAAQEQHPAATGHSTGTGVSAVVCEHHVSSVAGVWDLSSWERESRVSVEIT